MTVETIRERFAAHAYVASDDFATALELMLALGKPLLVEGPAGGGKTESAKVLAEVLDTRLIRLQCYEGIDAASALYEWNYAKQLLHVKLTEDSESSVEAREAQIFSEPYLIKRPLLEAIVQERAPVLLIDEIDRADDEFEAMLFEFLGEASVTVPEIGTFRAQRPPIVVLTSNRSRELHDALRRRCLYHWIEYPEAQRAVEILRRTVPSSNDQLLRSASEFVGRVRALELDKPPGMAETIDWVSALSVLGVTSLVRSDVVRTLGAITKTVDDRLSVLTSLADMGLDEEVALEH